MSAAPTPVVCTGCGWTLPAHLPEDECVVCDAIRTDTAERARCGCRVPVRARMYIAQWWCAGCQRLIEAGK
jgi:hypothetical protein